MYSVIFKTFIYLFIAILLIAVLKKPELLDESYTIENGEDVISKMYTDYNDKWYKTLTFIQDTEFYSEGELTRSQIWYEAMNIPQGLTIKFDSLSSGDGFIFKDNQQYVFRNGELVGSQPRVHDLLVLGFNVYGQSPEKTISELETNGYDLSKLYEGEFKERSSYFIGIESKEERASHFIIDKERMVFMKSVKFRGSDNKIETEFEDYKKIGKGWIAPTVSFYNNGELVMLEKYREIEIDIKLAENIFKENDFTDISW